MAKVKSKQARRFKIRGRIRSKIRGSADQPRLSVFRSNSHIYAQLIDDNRGHTITAASSLEDPVQSKSDDLTPTEVSELVGARLAEKASEAGIEKAVFDRGGYRYHGRVKALAEGAREGGLDV